MSPMFQSLGKWGCQLTSSDALSGRQHQQAPMLTLKDLPGGSFLPGGYIDEKVGLAVLAYRPLMAIPTLAVTVRRLHDVGKNGWWCCLWILPVPVVGWFWLIPWLMRPGDQTSMS